MNRHAPHRNSRLTALTGLAIASIALLTACGTTTSGAAKPTASAPTALGANEGAVSILAWPGYVEDGSNDPTVDWVSAFQDETGCKVTSKTYGTSDEAFNLMKTGDYDVVAASGDASLRLVAAGDVAPVNTDLIPNYAGIYDFLKLQAWNSVDGISYGIPHGYGANLLMYNKDVVTPAPTSWTVPTYSWPITSGGLIVRRAQASHLLIWTSVPQMDVFRILMSTSFRPGRGTGTSVMMRPGAAVGLTMARIFGGMVRTGSRGQRTGN